MVQKKLSLQLHHAASQSRGFPFPHHPDAAKSPRGADLKAKKMKKSMKRPATPPLCKTTPNYMKSTTCSDARKEQSQSSRSSSSSPKRETVSFKPARKFNSRVDAKRATCSSTLKDSKFPALLPLNPSGHSAVKVCPYTYCSLNGHHHPPLTTFLSAARRTRVRAPPDDDDFFVQIYMAARDQEEEEEEPFSEEFSFGGSDMEWETGYASLLHSAYALQNKDELLVDAQESVDEDGAFSLFPSSDDDDDDDAEFESTHHLQISTPTQQQQEIKDHENYNNSPTKTHDLNLLHEESVAVAVAVEASDEAQGGGETEEEIGAMLQFASDEAQGRGEIAEEISGLLQFAAKPKKVEEDGDELGDFNPRAPNFLEVEAEPEAERVDLRHQDVDERRNSDEWMVDYALRQVVTKLGPAKKRKVALLVEAFEKVMPLPLPLPPTKFDLHLSHVSRFDQPRPMQACS